MKIENKIQLRLVCLIIGLLHLVLIILRLYERVWELIILEEPFIIHDHSTIIISYIVQILSISLLIYGSTADNPNWTIPWLIMATPIFMLGTYYGITVLFKEELLQNVYNIFSICLIWMMWLFVVKYNNRPNTIIGSLIKYPFYSKIIKH